MALGQGARPIESTDGTKATVEPNVQGKTVIYVLDPESKAQLGRIVALLEELVTLKKFGGI